MSFGHELDPRLLDETISIERDCCPFFDFDYQPTHRRLSVTVQPPDGRPALDALRYALTNHKTASSLP